MYRPKLFFSFLATVKLAPLIATYPLSRIKFNHSLGHSILIGSLTIASALLISNNQNNFAILPLIFGIPITFDWIKCQLNMRKGTRLEKLKE